MRRLLEVTDLRVSFVQYARGLQRRVLHVLEGMDLAVDRGEVVALVGESGAGKSLLAHAVLGLLPPNAVTSGTVTYRGEPVPPERRPRLAGREIALLPQTVLSLDPLQRVGRQVRRAAELAGHADPEAAASAALDRFRLPPGTGDRYPHELSGGMARRVLTACATIGSPGVVIADEPTPGLHPEAVTEALSLLRSLADGGTGVVLITHDLIGALGVADRVVVSLRGRTVEAAPVDAFRGDGSDLGHPYTRALWRALPDNGFHLPPPGPWDSPALATSGGADA